MCVEVWCVRDHNVLNTPSYIHALLILITDPLANWRWTVSFGHSGTLHHVKLFFKHSKIFIIALNIIEVIA